MIKLTVEEINRFNQNTLVSHLGIEVTEVGSDYITARMPVDARTRQPFGLLHGGASAALAETLGSIAAFATVADEQATIVGLEINANHLRAVREGYVYGTARPLHVGRRTQVWNIDISNDQGQMVCVSRLTLMVASR